MKTKKVFFVLFMMVVLVLSACVRNSTPDLPDEAVVATATPTTMDLIPLTSTPFIVPTLRPTVTPVPTLVATSTPQPTATTVALAAGKTCPARVEIKAPSNAYLNEEDGVKYSVSYVLNEKKSYDVEVPCGATITLAFGNAKVDGQEFTAREDQGNVVYSTCDQLAGCSYTVSDFTVAHVGVTITYPGAEEAQLTVFNAVGNMFDPSNCGGSGCDKVFLTDIDTADRHIFAKRPKRVDIEVNDFTVQISEAVEVGLPNQLAEPLFYKGKAVGHTYFLSGESPQYVGVPETTERLLVLGHKTGTVIYCPESCYVDGVYLKNSSVAMLLGNEGDNDSPSDLNWTTKIEASDVLTVQVYMIYDDNVMPYAEMLLGKVYQELGEAVSFYTFTSGGFEKQEQWQPK